MKKQVNRKVMIVLIAIFMILGSVGTVKAATGEVTLKVSATEVKAGESFTIIVSGDSPEGLNGLQTTYEYDEKVLEFESATVVDSTKWASLSGEKEIAVICNSSETIKSADLFKLTFKVKSDATEGTETIIKTSKIQLDTNAQTDSRSNDKRERSKNKSRNKLKFRKNSN